jgi:hypothetical protein
MKVRSRCHTDSAPLTKYTAVEQLPLYLHRSYALLRELDEQVTGKHFAS